jgi:hypothetical protein
MDLIPCRKPENESKPLGDAGSGDLAYKTLPMLDIFNFEPILGQLYLQDTDNLFF